MATWIAFFSFLSVFLPAPSATAMQACSLKDPGCDPDRRFYVGFLEPLSGSMGNEVKFDVAHTHDIFTKALGGDYAGVKLTSAAAVRAQWKELLDKMTWRDRYIQYSSGHGSKSGLAVGINYSEIKEFALSSPAKEVLVFIMACYSGNLVKQFDQDKARWANWKEYGRTLYVMASSPANQTSSTGPGKDADEPGGPSGSAGSAFGHALWKALIGYADTDHDGITTLGELETYVKKRTQEIGGHTPVVTGNADPNLKIARVPPKEWVEALEHSTEGLTDSEVMERVQDLDAVLSLQHPVAD